jgi:hypothetical protein
MKQLFTFPTEELQQEDTIYITLAMELHATTLTNDKDRIQFENLVSEARKKLKDSDLDEKSQLLEQLEAVERDRDEYVKFIGGLAVYITTDDIYYYHLAIPVKDRVQISTLPYVLPLASNYQYTRDYNLLVLNRESIRLFEGHSDNIEELPIDEIEGAPVDLETALGTEKEGGELNYGSYSGGHNTAGTGQFFHGHGDTSEEKDIDRERYFRMVDDFVYNNYSNENKLPLIVYTVEENQAVFRDISSNEFLADTGINGSAANLSKNEIQERASQTLDEIIAHQRNELLEQLNETTPENRIENIPDDLASASLQGRIETLYVEKFFEIPGSINDEGMYEADNGKDDFVQQVVQNVLRSGGAVYILDETETPEDTPIAARLRY